MMPRKRNKQELDLIGERLIAGSRLSEAEIDRIASTPGLYDGVLARIQQEAETTQSPRNIGAMFGFRFVAVTGLVLVVAAVSLVAFLRTGGPDNSISKFQTPVAPPDNARPTIAPQAIFVKGFTEGRAEFGETVILPQDPAPQRAIYRERKAGGPAVVKANHNGSRPNEQFLAVTYTGDGGESARGGRVVRVDLSRASLFALGVDVPLENESPTVKADLLIGPDGVTRAIRLVE